MNVKFIFLLLAVLPTVHNARPHIVFILADDMGWNDFSFHGSDQIQTPNIDALAYNGVILNQHYSQTICTPSRSALLTGRYPSNIGMQGWPLSSSEPRALPPGKLLPQYLKDLGYTTRIVGKWHLGYYKTELTPTYRGFDSHLGYLNGFTSYYDHINQESAYGFLMEGLDFRRNLSVAWDLSGRYATEVFTEEAERIIREHDSSNPLFLYLAHLACHAGNSGKLLEAPQEAVDKFPHIIEPNRRSYAAMVYKLDESVGRVVKALHSNGMLDNSVIVFVSDNGAPSVDVVGYQNWGSNYPLRGLKTTQWEGGVRTPALIWSPGLGHRVSDQLIHITDWLPTLVAAAGGTLQGVLLDGVDQWSALVGSETSVRREALLQYDEAKQVYALRMDSWKITNASIYLFVSPLGSLIGGVLVESIGRRKSYLLGQILFITGWLLITAAYNYSMLISGRVIYGVAVGAVSSAGAILFDELAHPRFRGSVLVMSASFGAIGVLLMCTLGTALHWRLAAALATVPLIIHILILWFLVPETPIFLVKKHRIQEAELVLKWVWGSHHPNKVMKELNNLTQRYCTQYEEQKPLLHRWSMKAHLARITNNLRLYLVPRILKPFLIIEVFNLMQVPCGIGIVMFYTVDILTKAKGENLDAFDEYSVTIILSGARVVSLIISAVVMFRVGRRTVGILSGVGSAISSLAVGSVLYLNRVGGSSLHIPEHDAWIDITLITCYVCINSFGMYCLAYTMIGELLPARVRGELFGVIMATTSLFSGGADKIYPWLLYSLGIHGLFILFGVSSIVCTVFMYCLLPETFGLTLEEIEDYFQQPNIMWLSRNKTAKVPRVFIDSTTQT